MLKKFNFNFFNKKKGGFTYPIQKWLRLNSNSIDPMVDSKFLKMKYDHLNNKKEYRNFFIVVRLLKTLYKLIKKIKILCIQTGSIQN